MILMAGKAGVVDPGHTGVLIEPGCHGAGVFNMTRHPDVQGFQSLYDLEGVEGGETGPHIAQQG